MLDFPERLMKGALTEITPSNAARLRPVWTFSTGVLGGHEGQVVWGGTGPYIRASPHMELR